MVFQEKKGREIENNSMFLKDRISLLHLNVKNSLDVLYKFPAFWLNQAR